MIIKDDMKDNKVYFTAACMSEKYVWLLSYDGAIFSLDKSDMRVEFKRYLPDINRGIENRISIMQYSNGVIVLIALNGRNALVYDIGTNTFKSYDFLIKHGILMLACFKSEKNIVFLSQDGNYAVNYDSTKKTFKPYDLSGYIGKPEVNRRTRTGVIIIKKTMEEIIYTPYGTNIIMVINIDRMKDVKIIENNRGKELVFANRYKDGFLCVDKRGGIFWNDCNGASKTIKRPEGNYDDKAPFNCIVGDEKHQIFLPCSYKSLLYINGSSVLNVEENDQVANKIGVIGYSNADIYDDDEFVWMRASDNRIFISNMKEMKTDSVAVQYDNSSLEKYKYDMSLIKEGECGRKLREWTCYLAEKKKRNDKRLAPIRMINIWQEISHGK